MLKTCRVKQLLLELNRLINEVPTHSSTIYEQKFSTGEIPTVPIYHLRPVCVGTTKSFFLELIEFVSTVLREKFQKPTSNCIKIIAVLNFLEILTICWGRTRKRDYAVFIICLAEYFNAVSYAPLIPPVYLGGGNAVTNSNSCI